MFYSQMKLETFYYETNNHHAYFELADYNLVLHNVSLHHERHIIHFLGPSSSNRVLNTTSVLHATKDSINIYLFNIINKNQYVPYDKALRVVVLAYILERNMISHLHVLDIILCFANFSYTLQYHIVVHLHAIYRNHPILLYSYNVETDKVHRTLGDLVVQFVLLGYWNLTRLMMLPSVRFDVLKLPSLLYHLPSCSLTRKVHFYGVRVLYSLVNRREQ